MNRRILHFVAALLSLLGPGAVAQVPFTVAPCGCGSVASVSMPRSSYMLPMRSVGLTGRSATDSPVLSDAPTTCPPLNPPPATTEENTLPK
jgi:hypothetical protein